jgi:hypothetical protein
MTIHVGRMRAFGDVQDQGIRLQVNSICHRERTNQGEGYLRDTATNLHMREELLFSSSIT